MCALTSKGNYIGYRVRVFIRQASPRALHLLIQHLSAHKNCQEAILDTLQRYQEELILSERKTKKPLTLAMVKQIEEKAKRQARSMFSNSAQYVFDAHCITVQNAHDHYAATVKYLSIQQSK